MRLKDKVCIITGAAVGIGKASAVLFAQEGAQVVVNDIDKKLGAEAVEEIRKAGGTAEFFEADVSKQEEVRALIEFTVKRFGRVDVMFNNAGIVPVGPVMDCTEEEWHEAMEINVHSVVLGCQQVIPQMKKQGGGIILNTASIAGHAAIPNRGLYSGTKGAVIALTKSVAIDHIKDNIRVNCVSPGTVDTPSLRKRIAAHPDPSKALEQFIARQPMGRLGRPEDIACAALYLVSDESSYVTGITLVVDGGHCL